MDASSWLEAGIPGGGGAFSTAGGLLEVFCSRLAGHIYGRSKLNGEAGEWNWGRSRLPCRKKKGRNRAGACCSISPAGHTCQHIDFFASSFESLVYPALAGSVCVAGGLG